VLEQFIEPETILNWTMFDKLAKLHIKSKLEEVIQEKLKEEDNKKKVAAQERFKEKQNDNNYKDFD